MKTETIITLKPVLTLVSSREHVEMVLARIRQERVEELVKSLKKLIPVAG